MIIAVDEHISLTSISEEHAPDIYRLFIRDIDELKDIFSFARCDYTLEDEIDFIKNIGDDSRYNFTVLYDGSPCGKLGLYEHDKRVRMINLFYWIASEYRRKGIAYSCAKALMEYAFDKLGNNRIQLFINTDNLKSIRLAERLGCTYEGELRDFDWANGRYHIQKLYSILAHEFMHQQDDI